VYMTPVTIPSTQGPERDGGAHEQTLTFP
jgi:hypothetical protein